MSTSHSNNFETDYVENLTSIFHQYFINQYIDPSTLTWYKLITAHYFTDNFTEVY